MVGGSTERGSATQQRTLLWAGRFFLGAGLAFLWVTILLPPFLASEPHDTLYQPLRLANGIFIAAAFLAMVWGVALLARVLPSLDLTRPSHDINI